MICISSKIVKNVFTKGKCGNKGTLSPQVSPETRFPLTFVKWSMSELKWSMRGFMYARKWHALGYCQFIGLRKTSLKYALGSSGIINFHSNF